MTDQSTVPRPAVPTAGEPVLLQRLRDGDDAAFGELFELHAAAVRRLALGLAADRSEAEDITAETFFRVLQALRRGSGPRDNVRAYLLTVARRVSWEWHGAKRDVPVSEDELTFRAGAEADAHARSAEHTLITRAFTSLPERWRTVLWQTEVEGEQPAVVAPHFGLSANATAALARRARQGLRAAYLQAHLSVNRSADGCRAVVEKLGGYTAGSVTGTEARRIQAHLLGCASCRSTADELSEVCSALRAHAGVVALLLPASALSLEGLQSAGLLAGLKGILLGSKVKVGLALVSTAAAGVVGVASGPLLHDADTHEIGLPGRGGTELIAQDPVQPPAGPVVPKTATGQLIGYGRPEAPQHQPGPGELPNGVLPEISTALPGEAVTPEDSSLPGGPGNTGTPRDDVVPGDGGEDGTPPDEVFETTADVEDPEATPLLPPSSDPAQTTGTPTPKPRPKPRPRPCPPSSTKPYQSGTAEAQDGTVVNTPSDTPTGETPTATG